MLVEIKYEDKREPKGERHTKKAQFMTETKEQGRAAFEKWLREQDMTLDDVLVTSVRDATNDTVTLEVHDVKQTQKGKVV